MYTTNEASPARSRENSPYIFIDLFCRDRELLYMGRLMHEESIFIVKQILVGQLGALGSKSHEKNKGRELKHLFQGQLPKV